MLSVRTPLRRTEYSLMFNLLKLEVVGMIVGLILFGFLTGFLPSGVVGFSYFSTSSSLPYG